MRKSSIPNIFTFINLSFGILSILATLESEYIYACVFIIISALVDRYDGRIARFLDVTSDLGKELDSLSDLVSFGVAPAILVFVYYSFDALGPYGILGLIPLLTFPICGSFRLARYNATSFEGVFTGVPITVTGCFIAIFVLITINLNIPVLIPYLLLFLGSYLMVSNFKFKKI